MPRKMLNNEVDQMLVELMLEKEIDEITIDDLDGCIEEGEELMGDAEEEDDDMQVVKNTVEAAKRMKRMKEDGKSNEEILKALGYWE